MVLLLSAQSALDPAGPYAESIANLWWIFLGVCTVVWVLVVVFLLAGIFRRNRESSERRLGVVVGTSVGATVVALFALLFFSTTTGASLSRMQEEPRVRIELTAQQWWWSVTYGDIIPSRRFTTANEIYVPAGRPVELVLQATDVIHSIWIPNVHGKRDLIPGNKMKFVIQADRPGTYEGQCAEFCGLQHAKMRITLKALPEAEFAKWAEQQRQPARTPQSAAERRGQEVFMKTSCAMCHTIGGTYAHSIVGPDLTHIASRPTLAAGSLPNTPGHMALWITNPQAVKPGNRMPPNLLPPDDLQALIAYLGSLK